jgi:hypothetical protein
MLETENYQRMDDIDAVRYLSLVIPRSPFQIDNAARIRGEIHNQHHCCGGYDFMINDLMDMEVIEDQR